MFFKYRMKWSHGPSEWKIIESDSAKSMKEHFKNDNEYDWSEHFRGYEWVDLKEVPAEYIEKRIDSNEANIMFATEEIVRLKKIRCVKTKPSCNNCSHGPKKDCHYYHRRKMTNLSEQLTCTKMNKWKSMW